MNLSRNWLNEFVDLHDITDKQFNDEMTLSGSKVETIERLDESLKNVVAGKILSMEKHPDSDHMWVCQLDVGREEPVQIVTGAWNIHVGDLVPAALHKSVLPGGVKIEKGKLRGVPSNGMLCSLKELGLTAEHDFPYAVITPAALLNDYHPIDKDKPSIPADIKPGDKVFGPVAAAKVLECAPQGDGTFHTCLDLGGTTACPDTVCSNLHEGDLVAYNTKSDSICTLADLHAEQREFPHCIADGIFVLREDDVKPGDDIAKVIGYDDSVVEFEITPNRPDCLSVIGLAREASATFRRPLKLHTRGQGLRRQHRGAGRHRDRGRRALPALHRAHGEEREDRALPEVDARAPAQLRRAPDQQHRGHYELRHARVRPADARLRLLLRGRRQDRRPHRA